LKRSSNRFAFPTWWHYDVLRGLEYLRRAGVAPDERVAEAIELVASKRARDDRWPLETRHLGVIPVKTHEGEGQPSRWNSCAPYECWTGIQPESSCPWRNGKKEIQQLERTPCCLKTRSL
jgi:hypothetical protein